ncbi:MAG TPA: thioredoxin family protein [Hellea balneolensis]|uniref:Thioredoxin family protein n=1 Tax=Hellea balneolensis TaxID=287478 RepID=A0A7C3GAY0_9PROT|nr:thioredoxin family protein [Hellea balneolensis]
MKHIKVLGSGCKNCITTADLITRKAKELGVDIELEKVTDMATIMSYGAMSTPGVVIDEKLIHAGGVPTPDLVTQWLATVSQ